MLASKYQRTMHQAIKLMEKPSPKVEQEPKEVKIVVINHYPEEKPYFRLVFQKFDANDGAFLVTWNWWAFLFGFFWYIGKGMWVKGLALLMTILFSDGQMAVLVWGFAGISGNYDYYYFKKYKSQFV